MIAKLRRTVEHEVDIGVGSVVYIAGIMHLVAKIGADISDCSYALICLEDGFRRGDYSTMEEITKYLEKMGASYVAFVSDVISPF